MLVMARVAILYSSEILLLEHLRGRSEISFAAKITRSRVAMGPHVCNCFRLVERHGDTLAGFVRPVVNNECRMQEICLAFVADAMGLGKTLTVLSLIEQQRCKKRPPINKDDDYPAAGGKHFSLPLSLSHDYGRLGALSITGCSLL